MQFGSNRRVVNPFMVKWLPLRIAPLTVLSPRGVPARRAPPTLMPAKRGVRVCICTRGSYKKERRVTRPGYPSSGLMLNKERHLPPQRARYIDFRVRTIDHYDLLASYTTEISRPTRSSRTTAQLEQQRR